MNRLQKKCLIASAALHVLLGVILLVGPAFFVDIKKPAPSLPVLEMIPSKAVDIELYGGGNPEVKSPPAAAPALPPPAPVIQPPKPVPPAPRNVEPPPKPEPPPVEKQVVKPVSKPASKPVVEAPKKKVATFKPDAVKTAPKKPEIKVNIDAVVTRHADDGKAREQAREQVRKRREQEQAKATQAREEYEAAVAAQQRRADQIDRSLNQSMNNLVGGLSSGTTVEMPSGPGGAAFANFAQIIKSIYDKAWLVRDDITNTRATVDVEIVVRRDGRVMSARIVRPSGNPALDKSVREALDRVRSIVPFPEGATEVERHFKLGFNLQTKRLTG